MRGMLGGSKSEPELRASRLGRSTISRMPHDVDNAQIIPWLGE